MTRSTKKKEGGPRQRKITVVGKKKVCGDFPVRAQKPGRSKKVATGLADGNKKVVQKNQTLTKGQWDAHKPKHQHEANLQDDQNRAT